MTSSPTTAARKRRGAWYTPPALVDAVVAGAVDAEFVNGLRRLARPVRVLDPACGDGRFLAAASAALADVGLRSELVGIDVERSACDAAGLGVADARIICGDALDDPWFADESTHFDLVVGNPPYLSQMARTTTRGGSSSWGGGPYADAAAEFLALAAEVVNPNGGRVAFVLPQSLLAARDADEVRCRYTHRAALVWSWSSSEQLFDAAVLTCAVAFEFGPRRAGTGPSWTSVVADREGVPSLPTLTVSGTLGDRAWLNANFRDEYYGLVPAVDDRAVGPPLVTSGLIDPGSCLWGERSVRFAKRSFVAPRVDLDRLDGTMRRWAQRRLVPKVLVANQTAVVEAVADPHGAWLPGVPVVGVYPTDSEIAGHVAAVLTSPIASVWVRARRAGSGLSAGSVRLSPVTLAELPWPADAARLTAAAELLADGDVVGCGQQVNAAYGVSDADPTGRWWRGEIERIDRRRSRQAWKVRVRDVQERDPAV